MAVAEKSVAADKPVSAKFGQDSRSLVLQHAANELIFAVVGHVGSGTSTVASVLADLLRSAALPGGKYEVEILSARERIEAWAKQASLALPTTNRTDTATTIAYQHLGDEMRRLSKDNSAVARSLIARVRQTRARGLGLTEIPEGPIKPDGTRRAYVIESLRHPDEVQLLRHVYQEAFILIGVVCDSEKRIQRVTTKFDNAGRNSALDLMKRDAKGGEKHGQRVTDTFHLSDFFIDNSTSREKDDGTGNPDWNISDHLSRLIKIVSRDAIVRPETSETAMHHAFSASALPIAGNHTDV